MPLVGALNWPLRFLLCRNIHLLGKMEKVGSHQFVSQLEIIGANVLTERRTQNLVISRKARSMSDALA